ncbi:MAG: chemotaxis protein CheA [Campylobacterales bacterium]|nr:chemotaxis protein CheA [Campylobacterales bacterium]
MNPLLEQFLQEARENLKYIEQNLEELGSGDPELINSIFRAAHTLKGGSGIVGFEAVKNITHKAEDLLDLLRSKKIEYKESMLSALYDAFDEVLNLVEAAEQSGDVVEADINVQTRIINYLLQQMNKNADEKVAWKCPVNIIKDKKVVSNFIPLTLNGFSEKLPFKADLITENNINDKKVYAILFDVDEDCMVFGNDPIYALSLMNDFVISINSTCSKKIAEDILNGADDEDGLKLKVKILAIVHANYEILEESLYNFLDELYFLPLDIETLLDINIGESKKIEFIKDLVKKAKELISSNNIDELKSVLGDSLSLINSNTLEAIKIKRAYEVCSCVSKDDYSKLLEFIESIDCSKSSEEKSQLDKNSNIQVVKQIDDVTDVDKNSINLMLKQQLEQLNNIRDNDVIARVYEIVSKCAYYLNIEFNVQNSRESLIEYISSLLGIKTEKKESDNKNEQVVTDNISKTENINTHQINEDEKVSKTEQNNKVQKAEPKKDVIGKVVKIEQESIDHLMSIVGELLVAKNSLPYLAESVLEMEGDTVKRAILEKYSFIDRLTNQLQDLIMSMRMLPISYVFDRYPKLVREISKKLGKNVKLIQQGGDTKLDKNMIEMLADPLIHIVRNSLDHGIESPSERVKSGKDEAGTIMMKAYPQSDKVIIEIQDDGKGINSEVVVNKVIEKGLMDISKIEQLNDEEKLNLIFLPGLSTAESISEYSGRGVGMDVVKKSIENFGGDVTLQSQVGKGTKIIMSIPVSLAVTTLLHISMNGLHYGFPMDSVSETVKIDHKDITYLNNEPFVYIRGEVIPLIMIKEMLNVEAITKQQLSIVVLNVKDNLIAVVVNELLGQLDVVQKPLEGLLSDHPIVSGTALLGNGQIIMVLDPIGVLEMDDIYKIQKL